MEAFILCALNDIYRVYSHIKEEMFTLIYILYTNSLWFY